MKAKILLILDRVQAGLDKFFLSFIPFVTKRLFHLAEWLIVLGFVKYAAEISNNPGLRLMYALLLLFLGLFILSKAGVYLDVLAEKHSYKSFKNKAWAWTLFIVFAALVFILGILIDPIFSSLIGDIANANKGSFCLNYKELLEKEGPEGYLLWYYKCC